MTNTIIRPYRDSDRSAIRRICGDTAVYGTPIESVGIDRDLMVDALLSYYTDYEPSSILVSGTESSVSGYLTGCLDTRRYDRIYNVRIAPRIAICFLFHGVLWHPKIAHLLFTLARIVRLRQKLIDRILPSYPAHCHINLAPHARRHGIGSLLYDKFQNICRKRGVTGIHISAHTEGGKRFFSSAGFEILERYPAVPLAGIDPAEGWIMGKKLR